VYEYAATPEELREIMAIWFELMKYSCTTPLDAELVPALKNLDLFLAPLLFTQPEQRQRLPVTGDCMASETSRQCHYY
jgi:hypothetical protein